MTQPIERHEPKHPEVHQTIGDNNEGIGETFAVPEDSPVRRDHIPENDNPMQPQAEGSQPMPKVKGETNASETSRDDVNGSRA